MHEVSLNCFDLQFIGSFRIALSEENVELRKCAIRNVKHDVIAHRIDLLLQELDGDWRSIPEDPIFMRWVAKTSGRRNDAAYAFAETGRRYEAKNERKLNIAEHIGLLIFLSVQDKTFKGVHTSIGILDRVRYEAKKGGVRGARDIEVLRKIWKTYRGIVHLGMAITYCDDNPDQDLNVLHLAELFRQTLSQNCPKGTSKPYVDRSEQTSFVYLSKVSGPRFRDRGLSFEID